MPPTHWLRGRMDPSHTCVCGVNQPQNHTCTALNVPDRLSSQGRGRRETHTIETLQLPLGPLLTGRMDPSHTCGANLPQDHAQTVRWPGWSSDPSHVCGVNLPALRRPASWPPEPRRRPRRRRRPTRPRPRRRYAHSTASWSWLALVGVGGRALSSTRIPESFCAPPPPVPNPFGVVF